MKKKAIRLPSPDEPFELTPPILPKGKVRERTLPILSDPPPPPAPLNQLDLFWSEFELEQAGQLSKDEIRWLKKARFED